MKAPPPDPLGDVDSGDDTLGDSFGSGRGARFLSTLRPFKALDREILALVHSSMSEYAYDSGDVLMRQGEPGDSLIVIADGQVEIRVEEGGSHHVLKLAHTGEVLGEMALLTSEPRSASVIAVTPVRAWVLPATRFHELAAQHPRISVLLTLLLSSRLGRAEHDALTGKIFHGYRIKRRLGLGGMSVVYEAEEVESARHVALKMMNHRLIYEPAALDRFRREADIVQSFDHPNIARMYGRFEAFRTSFIVMEFCEGVSIADAISGRGPLPEAEVRKVLGQLATAMSHAHASGVIHRDIKPSNVMVTRDGAVKLMDFGLAGRLDDGSAAERILGTPKYMAPEQMTGGPVGRHTDVFALGHLAYEMLSGELLFKGDDFWALRKEIIRCRLPAFSRTLPGVSSELRSVLRQMLSREAERRSFDPERVGSWAAAVDYEALAGARARS
jgi:CRP-like cAMP-binding protein